MNALLQKIYGTRWNPSYQSGVLAVFFLAVSLFSGIALIFFYRVSEPYGSVEAIQAGPFYWLRGLHRYSSDAAVVAVILHVLKMMMQGRAFGPRARAWVSGIVLTALMIFIGVTGLVMVWDNLGQRVAMAGIRFIDWLPLFSEPPQRIFSDQANLGTPFFFTLMFLHMGLPLALAFLLWFHTARLARAVYVPERSVCALWGAVLLLISIVIPAPLGPAADLSRIPAEVPLDIWYAFWLPLEEHAGRLMAALILGGGMILMAFYPMRGKLQPTPLPSIVDEKLCDGCTQCFQDCPYDAISMVPRSFYNDGRHSELVAKVDPDFCVSCGICAGSCKPMGVGPPQRNGRDQLKAMEKTLSENPLRNELVVLACATGCGLSDKFRGLEGIRMIPTACSGSLHTSVMELVLRRGALGVMVISCPNRDCTNREGPKWLEQRVYHDREAELMARVDRDRVRLAEASRAEIGHAVLQSLGFYQELLKLEEPVPPEEMELKCVPPSTD